MSSFFLVEFVTSLEKTSVKKRAAMTDEVATDIDELYMKRIPPKKRKITTVDFGKSLNLSTYI